MKLVALLGKKLKDEEILQVLEDYQAGEVVYDFDRLREGAEDDYFVEVKQAGFAFQFDHAQVLRTVFCYVASIEGYTPVYPSIIGVPLFASFEQARQAAMDEGVAHSSRHVGNSLLGLKASWVRHERPTAWAHFEFRAGVLSLITLSCPPA